MPIKPNEMFLNMPYNGLSGGIHMADDNKITKDMTLGDCVKEHPETVGVFTKFGLHCVGCHIAAFETIEQGAKAHGLNDADVEKMVKELNEAVEKENKE